MSAATTLTGTGANYTEILWTQRYGETAVIGSPTTLITAVVLPNPGNYGFRLTLSNRCFSSYDDINITVTA